MRGSLETLSWPLPRLGEALEALARQSGLRSAETLPPLPDPTRGCGELLGQWIESTARYLGLEAEPVEVPFAEVEQLVHGAGPAILHLPAEGEPQFLVLLRSSRRRASILGPDLAVRKLSPAVVRRGLCYGYEEALRAEVDWLLGEAGVPKGRRARAQTAILREQLSPVRIGGCWLLRLPASASIWSLARHTGLRRCFLGFVGAHTVQYLLWLLAWWIVGRGALEGRLDWGWLLAWALLLLTLVPFRMLVTWLQGKLAVGLGGLLKQRLLYGALRLEPEEIRHQGAGQLLGRVIESEAVESLALSSGFLGLVAGIELIIAAVVLGAGAGGSLHVLLLLSWVTFTLLAGWRYFRHYRRWTAERLGMTHDLVERMVGYRTRLAQEMRERWHDGEDQAMECYLVSSRAMDRAAVIQALVPRGWLALGLIGLAPAFVLGQSSPALLAISLGGILLAHQALRKLAAGLSHIAGAAIAWKQVAPFFHAAARLEVSGSPLFTVAPAPRPQGSEDGQPVLEAHDLVFRYREPGEPVLRGCSLRVCVGDRLLLEGPSGGGKSTLASLLIGLRRPESGLLLLRGLDQQTLGAGGWRRRVVTAPQFHENHVLTGTFAFNLLMGRGWPPQPEDLNEAESLCRRLGLGDLLERMPAGLLQMVGDTGWQLSHGERSRLFIARALLQGADLIILDESFAALDPETLRTSLRCALDYAPTLLVIAHP
jgi:ATP-binding cassette, subfamily B, bacterial